MGAKRQIQTPAASEKEPQADSVESKSKRGGKRPGAGLVSPRNSEFMRADSGERLCPGLVSRCRVGEG
jgi:hypothetical protein